MADTSRLFSPVWYPNLRGTVAGKSESEEMRDAIRELYEMDQKERAEKNVLKELQEMVLKDTARSFYGDGVFTSGGRGPEKLEVIDEMVGCVPNSVWTTYNGRTYVSSVPKDPDIFWRSSEDQEEIPHHKRVLQKYKNKFYAHKKNNGSPLLRENWDGPKITAKVDPKSWRGIIGSIGV